MKNLLTQQKTEEENRKIDVSIPLINRKLSDNILLIDKDLTKLEDDAKCAFLVKLIELVKKPFNLIKTEKEKPHHPISHLLACFVESVRQPRFCFAEGLSGLTDGLAICGAELKGRKVAVGFSM